MATIDPVDIAALTAAKAALQNAGESAVAQKTDAWPALLQRWRELQQLDVIRDGAGDIVDSILGLQKAGGAFSLYMAKLAKNATKAANNPALRIPVLTRSDVTRWVESAGLAFLRTTPTTTTPTTGGGSSTGLLLGAAALGGLVLLSRRRK